MTSQARIDALNAVLSMLTFRDLSAPSDRARFFTIVDATSLFRPNLIEDERGRRTQYRGTVDQQTAVWNHGAQLTLVREDRAEVRVFINVADEVMRKLTGSLLYLTAEPSLFQETTRLLELVELGKQLYSLLQPCYGFVSLPGFPPLFGTALPMRGLPGWGWATWLGPEYRELVRLSPRHGVSVTHLRDGGKLYLLPLPSDVRRLDPAGTAAYNYILENVDPQLFQMHPPDLVPETDDALQRELVGRYIAVDIARRKAGIVKVPKFRFRDTEET